MNDITVLIIAQNEEQNILRAVRSALWADSILVVDGGSQDQTVALATGAGAKVVFRPFDGFAAQREFALSQVKTKWVLGLDADEEISGELAKEIRKILSETESHADGYSIVRENYFWGKPLRHVWKVDRQMRLFQHSRARIFRQPVHEAYVVDGPLGRIEGVGLRHFSYANVSSYIRKMDSYTTLAAPALLAKRKRIRIIDLFIHPLSELWRNLVSHRGYKDKAPGIVIALLSTVYNLAEYAKAMELQRNKTRE